MRVRASPRIPATAGRLLKPLAAAARRRKSPLYIVGGCVRDWLLGRPTLDIDLAVVGDPEGLARSCARLIGGKVEPFGRFGTRRVLGRRLRVDIASTRAEDYPDPAALPTVTATAVSIERDLRRRDFTVNALALRADIPSRELIDPFGGRRDLRAGVIRVLHPASFCEDPTRVFRAARFLGRFGFRPAPGLADMARAALKEGHAAKLSRHRVLHELLCLLGEQDPGPAFQWLQKWGYLAFFHPEFPMKRKLPLGVELRLAALALDLGPQEGVFFIDSFPFEHHLRSQLHEALALALSDQAPRILPDPFVAAAVKHFHPHLPPAGLKPCFLRGGDLIAAGLAPGPSFHKILAEAARLQRLGRIRSRADARAWFRSLENPSGKR